MAGDFFSDVAEPVAFKGLDSTDPLSFKVYDPDRLVLGKRMEDHLRPGVCFWHSFAWPGTDMFGVGTLDRPWLDGTGDEMDAARQRMAVAFEFFAKLGVPYYCFHDRDVAPEGRRYAGVPLEPRRARGRCRRLPGADRRPAAVGHGEPVHASALPGRRRHEPGSRGVRLRRGPGQAHARGDPAPGRRRTTCCGAAARATTRCSTPTSRREGDQLARFLHLVAEHKHKIGFEGPLLIEPKPMEPTKHQYDYDAATVHGFLVRNGLEGEYKVEHRGEPRHARRPQLPPRGRVRRRQRDARQHRRQPRRPAERLGHRPVPELGRGPRAADVRDPAGRRPGTGRLQLRRQAAPPEHRPQRPVPRPHRRARHARAGPARGRRPGRARRAGRAARRALRRLGRGARQRRSWTASLDLAALEARVADGSIDPRRVSGRPGAAREPRQPADLGRGRADPGDGATSSGSTSRRPRPRPSSSTSRAPSSASAPPSTASRARSRCGASRTRGCGGTGRSRRSGPCSPRPAWLARTSPPSG